VSAPPGRSSMMTCCPSSCDSTAPSSRAALSVALPAACGTISRIGWSGKSAATAALQAQISAIVVRTSRRIFSSPRSRFSFSPSSHKIARAAIPVAREGACRIDRASAAASLAAKHSGGDMFRTTRRIFLAGALATAMGSGAWAETYPDRPIHIIAPFPPGGLVDVLARALGDEMSRSMGQPVVVENKPGAGGNIGADIAAKAAPDGYTLLMTSPGIQSINQFLYKSMPFDPDKAFVPISMVADMSMVVVVHPKTGITTLKQLVDFAHAHPGKLNFGSAGIGTTGHLGLELLMHAGHMKFTHVPYKGAAPSVTDL